MNEKLSYSNISILQNIFEGITFIEASCECEPEARCRCGWHITEIVVNGFKIEVDCDRISTYKSHNGKHGSIEFNDNTTVNDFELLCQHLGLKLVRAKSM